MKKKLFGWIQVIVAATLLGVVVGHVVESLPKSDKKAKYVFLFIGDGMGNSHVATAESYLSYKEGKLGGAKLQMTQFPYYGTATTFSANKVVTCSSAAGTAIACGQKTKNGMVGMDADSVAIYSVAADLRNEGYKVGIISSVPVNHATPASFYAHNISRNNTYEISQDIVTSGFEYFAGSGFLQFNGADNNQRPTDVVLEENGYSVCFGGKEYMEKVENADKIILCQPESNGKNAENYTSEAEDLQEVSLREMLEFGIEFLGDDEPFFIMCEGGDIDWAAHDNKTMEMVENVLEFDDAIKAAYEFYLKYPEETLIIVTADHETGGVSLGSGGSNVYWEKMESAWLENGKKSPQDHEDNKALNKECSFGWTTGSHTGAQVPVYAIGCGGEKFIGRMDNTDIKNKILCK